jgi:hypothetical protein
MGSITAWTLPVFCVLSCYQTFAAQDARCSTLDGCPASNEAAQEETNILKTSLLQRTKGKTRAQSDGMSESALLARKEEIMAELASIEQELEQAEVTSEAEEAAEAEEVAEAKESAEETAEEESEGTPGQIIYAKEYLDAAGLAIRKKRLEGGLKEKLYHQTDMQACRSIFAHGGADGHNFRPGKWGLAGPGIYFAVKAFHTQWKAQKFGCMIEAVVETGKMHEVGFDADKTLTGAKALHQGFDSILIPRGKKPNLTPEVVIYFNDQIVKMTHYPCNHQGKRTGGFMSPKIEYTRKCAGAAAFPCVLHGGCNAPHEPDEPCQCTKTCKTTKDCCEDYDKVCDDLKNANCWR